MKDKIIELRCFDCLRLDSKQFVASFYSNSGEKFQMNIHERVPIDAIIRINTYYHTVQDFGDYFRVSVKQNFIDNGMPGVLELQQVEKYQTSNDNEIVVYKDLNTCEVFKMVEGDNKRGLNSVRLINFSKEKLVLIKEPHIFNDKYVVENWIHHLGNK